MNKSDLLSDETLDSTDFCPKTLTQPLWQSNLRAYFESLSHDESKSEQVLKLENEITPSMRSRLLDWMMEISEFWKFSKETYYLALSLLDRFLSIERAGKSEFQLLGLACLYISAKHDETLPPPISEFSKSALDLYSFSEIKNMELKVLVSLHWQILQPTFPNWLDALLQEWDNYMAFVFSELFCEKSQVCEKTQKNLVLFRHNNKFAYERYCKSFELLDICTMSSEGSQFLPSKLISAIVYVMVKLCFGENEYQIFPRDEQIWDKEDCAAIVERLVSEFLLETLQLTLGPLRKEIEFVERMLKFKSKSRPQQFHLQDKAVNTI